MSRSESTGGREEKFQTLEGIVNANRRQDSLTLIAELMTDADPEVRQKTLECIWRLDELEFINYFLDSDFIDRLIEIAKNDPSLPVRMAAIAEALGRYVREGFVMETLDESDYQRVRDSILEMFRSTSEPPEIRRCALEALGFITEPEVELLVRAAYESGDLKMRESALFAMGRSGSEIWSGIILKELQSRQVEFRLEAARAAGEIYLTDAAPMLERLTSDPDPRVQVAAAEALGQAGRLKVI